MKRSSCILVALFLPAFTAADPIRVPEVTLHSVRAEADGLTVQVDADALPDTRGRLLLTSGVRPWGWAVRRRENLDPNVLHMDAGAPPPGVTPRAWLVRHDLVASVLADWPAEGAMEAELDALGPGVRSAWVRAGSDWGIRTGDSWWLRVGGQPVARLDVRWVGPEVCFCGVVALASAAPVRPGQRVALWPTPGEQRDGRASTAVAFIDSRSTEQVVWVAAPSGVPHSTETHLDFFHDDRYIGYGLVERRDDRFWYANLVSVRGAVPPASSPTTTLSSAPAVARPHVGDSVAIRTRADIDAGRFVMRVFELTSSGALLNAGEAEGLCAGRRLTLYRESRAAGCAEVRRAQRSYAEIVPVTGDDGVRPELRVDDEFRVTAPPPSWRCVGTLEEVHGPDLFTARLSADVAAEQLLAIRDGDCTIGVALLVVATGPQAGGFVFECSRTAPLRAGQMLFAPADGVARAGTP